MINDRITRYYEYRAENFEKLSKNKLMAKKIIITMNIISASLIFLVSCLLTFIWLDIYTESKTRNTIDPRIIGCLM
jgi:hypothetical protein